MRIEVSAASPSLLEAALREFPERPAPCSEEHRGWLRVSVTNDPHDAARGGALQPGSHGLSFRLDGLRVWLGAEGGGRARVALSEPSVTLAIPESVPEPARDVAALLGIALPYLYRELGLFPVHSAAVLAGSTPVLLAGVSGSGKSTTAALLAATGMRWLADDVVLVDPSTACSDAPPGLESTCTAGVRGLHPRLSSGRPSGATNQSPPKAERPWHTLVLRGVSRAPRLDDASRECVAECGGDPSALSVAPDTVTLSGRSSAVLLFPRVHPGATCALEPLTRPQALNELVRCSLLMGERTPTADHLQALAALALRSRPRRLLLGRDVQALPALIGSLLEPQE